MCVQRAEWKGQVTAPKGVRIRYISTTSRLAAALHDARHVKSKRVLCQDDGAPLTRQMAQYKVRRTSKKAQWHMGASTFCDTPSARILR